MSSGPTVVAAPKRIRQRGVGHSRLADGWIGSSRAVSHHSHGPGVIPPVGSTTWNGTEASEGILGRCGHRETVDPGSNTPNANARPHRWERASSCRTGGEGGIRTPETGDTRLTVFETAAFNHSATSPRWRVPRKAAQSARASIPSVRVPSNPAPGAWKRTSRSASLAAGCRAAGTTRTTPRSGPR